MRKGWQHDVLFLDPFAGCCSANSIVKVDREMLATRSPKQVIAPYICTVCGRGWFKKEGRIFTWKSFVKAMSEEPF